MDGYRLKREDTKAEVVVGMYGRRREEEEGEEEGEGEVRWVFKGNDRVIRQDHFQANIEIIRGTPKLVNEL